MIESIRHNHKTGIFQRRQAEIDLQLNQQRFSNKVSKQSKKQKKLRLQPSYKEKQLFDDYNVGILIPEVADLRGAAPYSLTEEGYFPKQSKSIKPKKKKEQFSPMSPGLLSEFKTKKRRSQAPNYGVIEEIGLMLPSI